MTVLWPANSPDLAWERTPVPRQVSLMPWIVWTELTAGPVG